MINPHYDFESEYQSGDYVEQDAKGWLGIWKTIDDVPQRYRLDQFAAVLDADTLWEEFSDEHGQDWSEATRKYKYGKGWRTWLSYCEEHGIHPIAPTPNAVEEHLQQQREEAAKDSTLHHTRFRPLCRLFEYLRYHAEVPVRYNPCIMAVLLRGEAYAVWAERIKNRLPDDYEQ